MEAAILKAVEGQGVRSEVNAGLSLGEYGALIASGVMDAADAFKVVRQRGILMQNAVSHRRSHGGGYGHGCEEDRNRYTYREGIVSIANYNCPGQIVITGEEGAVDAACEALKAAGAKTDGKAQCKRPFHSQMLAEAGEKLGEVLKDVKLNDFSVPYVTNVTADYVRSAGEVKDLLCRQVASSVRWQQSVERMIADGTDTFIEIGPGRTLSGFMRKIDRGVTMMNIDKMEDFEKVMETLKGEGAC